MARATARFALLLYLSFHLQGHSTAVTSAYIKTTDYILIMYATGELRSGKRDLEDCVATCMVKADCKGGIYGSTGGHCYVAKQLRFQTDAKDAAKPVRPEVGITSFVLLNESELAESCGGDVFNFVKSRDPGLQWTDLEEIEKRKAEESGSSQ